MRAWHSCFLALFDLTEASGCVACISKLAARCTTRADTAAPLQDAVIREQLGRLSTLGVTLLDLPPEVAAAYAVPDGIAGGAAVLGGASTSAGAFAGASSGNSELQRLLHESAEIDMSAALAIIHRERTGGQPSMGSSAGMSQDSVPFPPPTASAAAASTQTEPSRPPTLGRWTQGRAERLGGPPVNQLPVTDEGLGKTFSFPRPRNPAPTQPVGPSLSPRRQPIAETASGSSGSGAPLGAPLHSEDSEATAAARALMNELSGSEDESEAPKASGGWLGRSRAKKPEPGQYEAEMQRQQAEQRERQRAEEQRNAAAVAAAAAAAAAAADADRRREQQRQADERAEQERLRAEEAARHEANRRAQAQRAREAAAAVEEAEARAAAQREAERAAAQQREAETAAATAAEQAHRRSRAAEADSRAARDAESDNAQAAAMDRAREHAAGVQVQHRLRNGSVHCSMLSLKMSASLQRPCSLLLDALDNTECGIQCLLHGCAGRRRGGGGASFTARRIARVGAR